MSHASELGAQHRAKTEGHQHYYMLETRRFTQWGESVTVDFRSTLKDVNDIMRFVRETEGDAPQFKVVKRSL